MVRGRCPTDAKASGDFPDLSASRKQSISNGAKILLDIAKESSDWFPPLKSALGGVSALIKHYENSKDVKERVEDFIPHLDRFKQSIATTTIDGDPEETNRRRCLTSTFRKIEELSQTLLAKGAIARFVDKEGDSRVVARLIERFREAIMCYQISQQQSIYRQVTHLTSSLDTLLKLQKESSAAKHKLESVMTRLERFRDATWHELQPERWAKVFDDLWLLGDVATGLHERITAEGYTECQADDLAVSQLAEDLRYAILEYQALQQQGVYDQNSRLINAADLSVLNSCRRARGAEYRHGNRRGCLKGTRKAVLDEIESWTKDFSKSPIFWLNGLAGTGKSTIAQTISEWVFADGLLGASFFCSRDFEDRSNLEFIFSTLAFQLAHKYPQFRSVLVPLLQSDPDIVHESLYGQMGKLIVEPLRSADVATVIVIDALDECKDDEPQSAILSVMGRFMEEIPKVKFFVTGRPEPRIKSGFRLALLKPSTEVFVLHDVHPSLVDGDVRVFLKHGLSELAHRRGLGGWPNDKDVDLLCRRAAGLFVYAVATVKFLDSRFCLPNKQLETIVNSPGSTDYEGKTQLQQNKTLDSLYIRILQETFDVNDPAVHSKVRSIIGAIALVVNPLPPSGLAELVGLETEEVLLYLTSVQSLLTLDEDLTQPVKPFHKSFPDFITNPSRCLDKRFHTPPANGHLELALGCFRVMDSGLHQNLLSLPNYALNSEVEDLPMRVDDHISFALRYACQSWHNHLTDAREGIVDVLPHLRAFLTEKFLDWLEVASVLGAAKGAVVALEKLIPWLREVSGDEELLDTARDYFHFVTEFFEVINLSATHIYHSALELSPLSSTVRKLYYHRRLTRLPRVAVGTLDSWDQSIGVPLRSYDEVAYTWSTCGRFIATRHRKVTEIRDALTFDPLSTLPPIEHHDGRCYGLTYSPDGRSLACLDSVAVTIYDVQTGGVAKEIGRHYGFTDSGSLAWSLDGKSIGIVFKGWLRSDWGVQTFDVSSGATLYRGEFEGIAKLRLWAHDASFRVMVEVGDYAWSRMGGFSHTFQIYGVGSALTKIGTFGIKLQEERTRVESFSPATYCISVAASTSTPTSTSAPTPSQFLILDILNSERSLEETSNFYGDTHSFSSDGSLFAALSEGYSVHIWKYILDRYVPWREFSPRDTFGLALGNLPFQFSPTLSSVLSYYTQILRVWRLDESPTALATRHHQPTVLSQCGTYIATAHVGGSTVTITNIHSQTPLQIIDTDMKISAFALTGNVLLVTDTKIAVAWLLTEGGVVGGVFGNSRAGPGDSIWTVGLAGNGERVFLADGHTVFIESTGGALHAYHTGTGEVLQEPPSRVLSRDRLWGIVRDDLPLGWHGGGSGKDQPVPRAAFEKGWVKSLEGEHRMWVPAKWRISTYRVSRPGDVIILHPTSHRLIGQFGVIIML